jgi:octaprenyl-diphosphate synthase
MLWGNEASVLVGDFLLGQAFKMMVEVGSLAALDILSSAAAVIAEGEVMQLDAAKDLRTDEATYLAVVRAKTAVLFAAAAEVGPVVAGEGDAARAAFSAYGLNLGLAFQLVDDALDYGGSSQSLGKRVGDDFREGKITLPVILAFAAGGPDEKAFWRRCIEEGDIGEGDLATAIGHLARHGAIAGTLARARDFGTAAVAALDGLAPSPFRRALADVVGFTLARTH